MKKRERENIRRKKKKKERNGKSEEKESIDLGGQPWVKETRAHAPKLIGGD